MNLLTRIGIAACAGVTIGAGSHLVSEATKMKKVEQNTESQMILGIGAAAIALGACVAVKNLVDLFND